MLEDAEMLRQWECEFCHYVEYDEETAPRACPDCDMLMIERPLPPDTSGVEEKPAV